MSFVDIDDLCLAIDKVMIMLLDGLEQRRGTRSAASRQPGLDIDVVFGIAESRFEFEASRSITSSLSQQAVQLLDDSAADLVDVLRIDGDIGAIWLSKSFADVR